MQSWTHEGLQLFKIGSSPRIFVILHQRPPSAILRRSLYNWKMGHVQQLQEPASERENPPSAEQHISTLQEDLKLQVARLSAANQELEAFSYSISHDLRAPLRHIDGFIALLLKPGPETRSEKDLRYLKIIADSARQMGRLMDDLLSFSRLNRAELQPAQFAMTLMVQTVIDQLKPDIGPRQI